MERCGGCLARLTLTRRSPGHIRPRCDFLGKRWILASGDGQLRPRRLPAWNFSNEGTRMAITSAKVTTNRSIAEMSEMLRTFGESKPDKPAAVNDVVALAPVESSCDGLKAAAVRLMAELATIKRELQTEREETRKERDRFRDFLRTQRRLLENHALGECHPGTAPPALQYGGLAEAEAVFAAQRRL
jgi:hypothetical protein